MKKTSTSLLNKISDIQLSSLTMEIKETIATGIFSSNCRTFTAADLWNIQRHARSRYQRRFL